MEININNFGNMGIRPETFGANGVGANRETSAASNDARLQSNLTIGEGSAALVSAEPVADVPDAALDRDDALGKLMNAAFNLPPPPMPSFST